MPSHSPESGTADLAGNDVPMQRQPDSRVVVIPSLPGEELYPDDVLPDEKTVISAGKVVPPPPGPLVPGTKHPSQHLGETLVGRRLEHYELLEFVGGGGMGAVFRANDTRLGRTVAVKVLSRDQSSEENVRRFRNEAQSAARLDHRYIARVYYVGEDAGLNFIVFEFIEGTNLRDIVQQNGPLPLADALRYTMEVAEALAHASQRDVVHRDIKPSNVLITPHGHVKLVDMGLARLHQVESSFDDLTASGVTLGTFDYISPEQARDPRAADVRSDIYSLGCTLYFMLAAKPPFPDGSALQKLLRHNGVDPPDIRLFRPELPPAIGPLLSKMLAKRPVQRQQTAEELVAEIDRLARELGLDLGVPPSELIPVSTTPRSAWTGWTASIVGPLVALGAVLALLEFSARPLPEERRWQLQPQVSADPELPPEAPSPQGLADPVDPAGFDTGSANSTENVIRPQIPVGRTPTVEPTPPLPNNTEGPLSVGPPPDSVASRMATVPPKPEVDTPPPKPPTPRIVVHPGAPSTPDGDVVPSLSLAVSRAIEKGIGEIELNCDDLIEQPFEMPPGKLHVRPASGRRPRVIFRPDVAPVTEQPPMIRLLGGSSRLSLSNMDIRLELPAEPSSGWALFGIYQGQILDLNECVVTVVDQDATGSPQHAQVSVVQLQTRQLAEMMKMDDEMTMVVPARITLSHCLVRGEATFLSMHEELPVQLEWDEGLFISSKRLIETGGAATKPKLHSRIEVDLNQVTVAAQQGVFQMKRRNDASYHFDLEVKSDRSIFSVGSEAPLFEFAGMPSVDDIHFSFRGADNCYPRESMIFLRAKPYSSGEGTLDFDLANRSRWSEREVSPDLGVVWQSPPGAEIPPHDQDAEHYRLAETSPHKAGFHPDELPKPFKPQPKPPKPAPEPASDSSSAPPESPSATSAPKPNAESDAPSE
jgi:predicted Ser/Thr protein kinase